MTTTTRRHPAPYWSEVDFPARPPLDHDTRADVLVVGAGITGLTTAYLLAREGMQVVVVERDQCASADTGHTTAHVTMVTDTRLQTLVSSFGRSHAQAVWDAGLAAVATIDDIVRTNELDAAFGWVDGYLHAPRGEQSDDEQASLMKDARLASELGFDAEFVTSTPLVGQYGIRFTGQARVHPRKYLAGVASAIEQMGGRIYERSPTQVFRDDSRSVTVNGHTVAFDHVVIATHNPLVGLERTGGAALFQTKLAPYTSYVVAARVPRGTVPDALWWDTADPYTYIRLEPQGEHDLVIIGGEDHKTGQQEDTQVPFRRLTERLAILVPDAVVSHRWSGQVIETPDGLPYIGESAERQFTATGFGGNGMTFGTLAGLMIADAVRGRTNPWAELFHPGRKALTRGLWDYLKENADYPYYMIRDRFAGAESRTLREVRRGEGVVIERDGKKLAAFRDASGAVVTRSAICTHMGCTVGWNAADQTWDCPCHGSRFRPTGEVIAGPAESPLPNVE